MGLIIPIWCWKFSWGVQCGWMMMIVGVSRVIMIVGVSSVDPHSVMFACAHAHCGWPIGVDHCVLQCLWMSASLKMSLGNWSVQCMSSHWAMSCHWAMSFSNHCVEARTEKQTMWRWQSFYQIPGDSIQHSVIQHSDYLSSSHQTVTCINLSRNWRRHEADV